VANGFNYRLGILSARAFLGQFVTLVPVMAVLQGTRLQDFQAGFDAAHRAALGLEFAGWIPAITADGGGG